jgi:hypothetical protein
MNNTRPSRAKQRLEFPNSKIEPKVLIVYILVYSPKKKKTKPIAECSVKKPATNSLSASGKSNGARFVSAKALITNIGIIGYNTFHLLHNIRDIKLRSPLNNITPTNIKLKVIE